MIISLLHGIHQKIFQMVYVYIYIYIYIYTVIAENFDGKNIDKFVNNTLLACKP